MIKFINIFNIIVIIYRAKRLGVVKNHYILCFYDKYQYLIKYLPIAAKTPLPPSFLYNEKAC